MDLLLWGFFSLFALAVADGNGGMGLHVALLIV